MSDKTEGDAAHPAATTIPPLADDPASGRRWFDMGGLPAGQVLPEDHDHAIWEKRVDALLTALTTKGVFTVDGLRRALEDMGPEAFEQMSYYERWAASIAQNLVDAGVITSQELAERMAAVSARGDDYGAASLDRPPQAAAPPES